MADADLVWEYIQGIQFPKGREEVVSHARSRNAPGDVVEMLSRLPDRQFESAADVLTAVDLPE
ncbi:MAG TPA: DUF2795 domain-containing protein [Deltaproteobacteria bacterium]|nr:DUF2795 domain-containing protein [Deltaproteobacteria bacterium]HOI06697.1 DUF2795 domain-containing protein [Deltaproteobacteria bacterium]